MSVRKFGAGQSVKRVEDIRLVTGQGRYASDACEEARLKAAFVRSPVRPRALLDRRSATLPGHAGRARRLSRPRILRGSAVCLAWRRSRTPMARMTPLKPYPVMADGAVDHVGDIVAMVVADTADRGPGRRRGRCPWTGTRFPRSSTWSKPCAPARRWCLRRRPATSPMTRSRRQTKTDAIFATGRRARLASKSSTRASSPITWSRAPRAPTSTQRPAKSRSNSAARACTSSRCCSAIAILNMPAENCASSPRTSAAASAPRT